MGTIWQIRQSANISTLKLFLHKSKEKSYKKRKKEIESTNTDGPLVKSL